MLRVFGKMVYIYLKNTEEKRIESCIYIYQQLIIYFYPYYKILSQKIRYMFKGKQYEPSCVLIL